MIEVSHEIIENLEKFRKLVLKWNKAINLISPSSGKNFWQRHIIDSLQLTEYIDNKDIHLLDIGSGGGLPGIILSIVGIKKVTLIESDTRKCIFLKKASKISNNITTILNQRVEKIKINCDILTCRAFAPLNKIFYHIENISINKKILLLKGKNYLAELKEAQKHWSFNYLVHQSITSEEGKILEISNLVKIYDDKNNFYS